MANFFSAEPRNSDLSAPDTYGRLIWMMIGIVLTVLIMLLVYINHRPTPPTPLATSLPMAQPAAPSTLLNPHLDAATLGSDSAEHPGGKLPPNDSTQPPSKPRFTFYRELSDPPPHHSPSVSTDAAVLEGARIATPEAEQKPTSTAATDQTANHTTNQTTGKDRETVQPHQAQIDQKKIEPSLTGNQYLLQTGSFKNQLEADRHRARLLLQGYNAKIRSIILNNGQTWHRVVLGPFNKESAVTVQTRLDVDHIQSQLRKVE